MQQFSKTRAGADLQKNVKRVSPATTIASSTTTPGKNKAGKKGGGSELTKTVK